MYRFFTNRSELEIPERDSERSEESIFVIFLGDVVIPKSEDEETISY